MEPGIYRDIPAETYHSGPEITGRVDGSFAVHFEGGATATRKLDGTMQVTGTLPDSNAVTGSALRAVLDPAYFGSLNADGRREALLHLMRVRLDADTVLGELGKRHDAKLVAELREAGGDLAAWHGHATRAAQDARGAWKRITGEAYGEKKAATWKREQPAAVDDEELAQLDTQVRDAQAARDLALQELGQAAAAAQAASAIATRTALAALLPERQARQQVAREACAAAEAAHKAAKAELGRMRLYQDPPEMSCPHCDKTVYLVQKDRKPPALARVVPPPANAATAQDFADATARERAAEQALRAARLAEEDALADVMESRVAAQAKKEGEGEAPGGTADIGRAKALVAAETERLATVTRRQNEVAAARAALKHAIAATEEAAEEHARVLAWTAIREELEPGGIPNMLLQKQLDIFNATMGKIDFLGFQLSPQLFPSMQIIAGHRPYNLLSESERWRVDATIAAAFAILSGLKIVALDRFDVLQPSARSDALLWLADMIAAKEIESAIVLVTTRNRPDLSSIDGAVSHSIGHDPRKSEAA